MSLIKKLLPATLGLILTALCQPAFAWYEYPDYLPNEAFTHIEISGAFGPNWTHSDSTHVVVSKYETDSILESGVSNSSLWKVGIGYHLFEDRLRKNQFLTDLLLSVNVYQSSQTIRGYVEQYQLPQFNNYSFRAPVQSTRLLFEVRPGILTVYRFTPYPVVGIGVSWNNTSYNEAADPGIDPKTSYELGAKTNIGFTYNLGAGLRIDLVPHLSGSIEYLYSYLGSAMPSGSAVTPTGLLSVPSFILHSQAVMFGLNYKL